MEKLKEIIFSYWEKNKLVPISIVFSFIFVFYSTYWGKKPMDDVFTILTDPVFSITSIILTVGLTIMYAKTEWINTLPHRLNVHFINTEGKYLASCYNVHVMPNSDLRALGQQVGAQMFGNQHLKFNPSLVLNKQNEPIKIKDKSNENEWVKFTDINFYLTTDQYNQVSAYYTIWNIYEKSHDTIYQLPSELPLHISTIKTEHLLSNNSESTNQFKKLPSIDISIYNHTYILNSPVIEGNGDYKYQIINESQAKAFIKDKSFKSAIGYETTAEILSDIFEMEIPFNRIQIKLKKGDQCLVFRIKDRVDKDKKYTKEEIKCMEKEFGILTKLSDEA
jgi:hypothetical protein